MKSRSRFLLTGLLALALLTATAGSTLAGSGMGTAFTYRGQLSQSGSPYTGQCDFRFGLWDASTAGSQISSIQSRTNVAVTAGVFDVSLDFGAGAFDGSARWLETEVRCPAGSGSYATLTPRQNLTPMPYSLYASVAGSIVNGGVTTAMLSGGSITNDKLANSAITVTAGAGLSGGGSVALGGSTALSIPNSGVTTAMLAPAAVTAAKVDSSSVQVRVNGSCLAGSAMQSVAADGTVTCASGGVTGSGTAGYLPRFTGSSTLGNSLLQDDGATLIVGGALTANGDVYTAGFSSSKSYCVQLRRVAAQALINGTTTISWDTADVNTDAMWSSGTPSRITFNHAGMYLIVFQVTPTGITTNEAMALTLNGATTISYNGGQTNGSAEQIMALRAFAVNDYITASFVNAYSPTPTTTAPTYISACFLGRTN